MRASQSSTILKDIEVQCLFQSKQSRSLSFPCCTIELPLSKMKDSLFLSVLFLAFTSVMALPAPTLSDTMLETRTTPPKDPKPKDPCVDPSKRTCETISSSACEKSVISNPNGRQLWKTIAKSESYNKHRPWSKAGSPTTKLVTRSCTKTMIETRRPAHVIACHSDKAIQVVSRTS